MKKNRILKLPILGARSRQRRSFDNAYASVTRFILSLATPHSGILKSNYFFSEGRSDLDTKSSAISSYVTQRTPE